MATIDATILVSVAVLRAAVPHGCAARDMNLSRICFVLQEEVHRIERISKQTWGCSLRRENKLPQNASSAMRGKCVSITLTNFPRGARAVGRLRRCCTLLLET